MYVVQMKTSQRFWGRLGDVCFKLLLVFHLFMAFWQVGMVGEMIRGGDFSAFVMVFPLWQVVGIGALFAAYFLLVRLPLFVGCFLRRRWARILWIACFSLDLLNPLINRWVYGPFSSKNRLEVVVGSLTGALMMLVIGLLPVFKRYMNREGGRIWLKISVVTLVVSILFCGACYGYWNRMLDNRLVEIVTLPTVRPDTSFPEGWTEASASGLMIPVPVGTTNDYSVYEDGGEVNSFANKTDDGSKYPLAFMTDSAAMYTYVPAEFGVTTLERDFLHRYRLNVLMSAMFWMTRPADRDVSRVGLRSGETMDLMFELWTNDRGSWAEINIEKKPSRKHYDLIFRSPEPVAPEDMLRLVSGIRSAP